MFYPRTSSDPRIKSESESRNILPNQEQSAVDMHGGRRCANACERRISLKSKVSGWRMPQLYQPEVSESVESYRGSEDINSGLEKIREKININVVSEKPEEAVGVYEKDKCSIPAGMGKYFPLQTNRGVTGDVLIEISDKTVPGLILPEILYNVKKKLCCIFLENHNSKPLMMKREQTIGLVTLCVVMQGEQGQTPEWRKEATKSITRRSNDMDTCIGGASVGNTEKAGRKADSVESIEKGQFYETQGEQHQFTRESFLLDSNEILNADAKLKEAVIKLYFRQF